MYGDQFFEEYLSVPECAERLGISVAKVQTLVQQRVLKSYGTGTRRWCSQR